MITKEKIEALTDPGATCDLIILPGDPAALRNLCTGDCGGAGPASSTSSEGLIRFSSNLAYSSFELETFPST